MTLFRSLILGAVLLFSTSLPAAALPGFRVAQVARADGFGSSVVVDSQGHVYFTTTNGWIHRVENGAAVKVASLPTQAGGNGGLLGMALLDDTTAVVHYTTSAGEKILDDVIARVDLASGNHQVIRTFVCDIDFRERGVSNEHHGGNPTISSDGSIFVGIGEYGAFAPAQKTEWNGGKIWRIDPNNGAATQWAIGMRNPYDLAWDPELAKIVVPDNGPTGGDEIHVLGLGENGGWYQAPAEVTTPPVYLFPKTVAPTGFVRLSGANTTLPKGYLLAAFVPRALYYFPSITATSAAAPIALLEAFDEFIIDVTEGPDGSFYLVTGWGATSGVFRVSAPARGDCDGDGLTDWRDVYPTMLEIRDASTKLTAHEGEHAGTFGCDANGDDRIDDADLAALVQMIGGRRRAVR